MDVSSRFQELRRRPGLTIWRPTVDRSCERTFESYEELIASSVDERLKAKLTEGHFPPNDVEAFNLQRWYGDSVIEPLPCLIFAACESILIYRTRVHSSLPSCRRFTGKARE